jgi:hypothetical protein
LSGNDLADSPRPDAPAWFAGIPVLFVPQAARQGDACAAFT